MLIEQRESILEIACQSHYLAHISQDEINDAVHQE